MGRLLLPVAFGIDFVERRVVVGDGALGTPDAEIDVVADELGGAVALRSVDAAGVGAARGEDELRFTATELQSLDEAYLGQELDLIAKYAIGPRSNILFGYSHFWRGDKILGPTDADFTYVQWELNF